MNDGTKASNWGLVSEPSALGIHFVMQTVIIDKQQQQQADG